MNKQRYEGAFLAKVQSVTVFGATSVSQDHKVENISPKRELFPWPQKVGNRIREGKLSCAEKFDVNAHAMENGTVASHCTEYLCVHTS